MKGDFFMEIKIEHLNKSYGKQTVLNDIRLHIPVVMYGLLGENGAGKSTFINAILNINEPEKGEVKIFNKNIRE